MEQRRLRVDVGQPAPEQYGFEHAHPECEYRIAQRPAMARALDEQFCGRGIVAEQRQSGQHASAGDQKLTMLYADSKQQMAAGDEAVRQEVAQQLALVSAKADSAQASALAAVEGEAQSRRDLESRLSLSIDGLRLADEAQKAQIGQVSLKLDEAVSAIASARAWAEAAIASNRAWAEAAIAGLVRPPATAAKPPPDLRNFCALAS